MGGRERVEHAAVTGRRAGPGLDRPGGAGVEVVADPGGQHRLDERVQRLGHARRGDVVGQQHVTGRERRVGAAVAGREPLHELRVGRAAAGAGAVRLDQRAVRAAGAAEPVRRDRRDQRERRDPLGRVDDRLHGHAAAEAPADQVDPVQPELVEQRGDVVRPVPHAAGRVHRDGVGVAEPAQVHRQRPVRRRQGEHRRLPEQAGGHVAVHEQHRWPVAAPGLQHVLGQPGGRHPAGRDAGHQRRHRALQPPSSTSALPLTNEAASEQR